ncbi:hypothetical protein [Mycolicibacterium brumae]|uniref:DUF3761 domain-containing protein n=1 Tax=Mycolicibacterium brumae TaxID=85968 RepID=A0A2G5P5G2_9MYCO|nr:hypothetical protein [Mycolicibacterium brumae]MCV7191679.1 hypothetical protein [Mycolicibacterium brumae]PIB73525.1 hypothetical protein CQY22_016465 [Mycolicibacterium brumae]RWA20466.1 hypothetical protein MBRU_02080 [Mycolicibacterium brumae DSM 44177]UWW07565.1 hypothetical protein L2Z93_000586 [Mycolicibacterium brumae]
MRNASRFFIAACAVTLALGHSAAVAGADPDPPPAPGSSCGDSKVITTIGTCEPINSDCTGYDFMVIGRVAANGRCVFPGVDGTTW